MASQPQLQRATADLSGNFPTPQTDQGQTAGNELPPHRAHVFASAHAHMCTCQWRSLHLIFFSCLSVFACMYGYAPHTCLVPKRPKRGFRSSGTGVMGDHESP